MCKWIFFILYLLMAVIVYNFFGDMLDDVKAKCESKNLSMSKEHIDNLCDLVFIFFSIFWPIFLIQILRAYLKKRGTRK